jgi:hypothetical protein
VLCADCDNAAAARRAEQVRKSLGELAQAKMEGRTVTVSFGVTEIQPGDTPETMLRRADRALLMAKAKGRNVVVQLGSGSSGETVETRPAAWARAAARPKETLEQELITPVPVRIAIEKLRGFVADHRARIASIDGNRVQLEIDGRGAGRLRRLTDRLRGLRIDLCFEEERLQGDGGGQASAAGGTTRTKIKIVISPRTNRDRRRSEAMAQAREVLMSFRSYLMAAEEGTLPPAGPLQRVARILAPWLVRK